MLKHSQLLRNDNDKIKEQNRFLETLVKDAQTRVKELSSTLQKGQVNVMPSMTVCNDLIDTKPTGNNERSTTGFASAGFVSLKSPALCLSEGQFIAAGETEGKISLWSTRQPNSPTFTKKPQRNPSGSLYRFSFEKGPGIEDETSSSPFVSASLPLSGHTAPVCSLQWVNNHVLSSVSLDSSMRIWDITTSKSTPIHLPYPSVSHTMAANGFIIASCTNQLFSVDERDGIAQKIPMDTVITTVSKTDLGLLMGTLNGNVHLIDPRMWKSYQYIQLSPSELPISKISGTSMVSVTSFDGVIRVLGGELPLFVEKEYARSPIMGSIIGSCCVSLKARDDFVVCGSTNSKAIVWSKSGNMQTLNHKGSIIHDCIATTNFVGSFLTCDSSSTLTMWACTFSDTKFE